MNEPFAGDVFANPFLMEPAKADLLNLQPFYDIVSPYIRNVDPTRLVLFEPVTWSNILEDGPLMKCYYYYYYYIIVILIIIIIMVIFITPPTGFLGLGFTHPPGGAAYSNTSALAFHYYLPPNFSFDGTVCKTDFDIHRRLQMTAIIVTPDHCAGWVSFASSGGSCEAERWGSFD